MIKRDLIKLELLAAEIAGAIVAGDYRRAVNLFNDLSPALRCLPPRFAFSANVSLGFALLCALARFCVEAVATKLATVAAMPNVEILNRSLKLTGRAGALLAVFGERFARVGQLLGAFVHFRVR